MNKLPYSRQTLQKRRQLWGRIFLKFFIHIYLGLFLIHIMNIGMNVQFMRLIMTLLLVLVLLLLNKCLFFYHMLCIHASHWFA